MSDFTGLTKIEVKKGGKNLRFEKREDFR